MSNIHIESIEVPFNNPSLAAKAMRLIARAEGMGLLRNVRGINKLDLTSFRKVMGEISGAGIGEKALTGKVDLEQSKLGEELERVMKVLDESPVPEMEWQSLLDILDENLLGRLLNLSGSSIRRYSSGARKTPDAVADRLHFLALVVGDLRSGYNEYGIRRWFQRPRTFLKGKSVIEALTKEWTPDGRIAKAIRDDARWVTSSGAS